MQKFRIELKGTLTTTVVGEKNSTVHNLDTSVTIDDTTFASLLKAGQQLLLQASTQVAKALHDASEWLPKAESKK